jgi:predicted CoA-binding protein
MPSNKTVDRYLSPASGKMTTMVSLQTHLVLPTAQMARNAWLTAIVDKCIKMEHGRYWGYSALGGHEYGDHFYTEKIRRQS